MRWLLDFWEICARVFRFYVTNNFVFFYSSPDIISTMKPKSVRWVGHVARKGDFGIPETFRESRRKQASWKDTFHIKMSRSVVA
jgi:hypothetical protein